MKRDNESNVTLVEEELAAVHGGMFLGSWRLYELQILGNDDPDNGAVIDFSGPREPT